MTTPTPTPTAKVTAQSRLRELLPTNKQQRVAIDGACDAIDSLERELAAAQERAQAAEARVEECEMIITAMTQWLEKQQPDVFRRGLWDAIAEGKK